MDRLEKYSHWEEAAEYDIKTAEAMQKAGRYLYVAFMCQQSIEKIIKGIYVFNNEKEPPRTHNILSLYEKIDFKEKPTHHRVDEFVDLFEELFAYYISERYPSYKEKTIISSDKAKELLLTTKEAFSWLKSLRK